MDAGNVLGMSAFGLILFLLIFLTAATVVVCILDVIDFAWPGIKRFINGRR